MTTNLRQIRVKTNNWAEKVLPLVITLSLLSSCYFPGINNQQITNTTNIISDLNTDYIDIVFQLEVPDLLDENETVVLEVIDDVTGLHYNTEQYQLQRISDQVYYTILSVPAGSLIKYRYLKIADGLIPETTLNGLPVRYRLYYASTHGSVTDILQSWQGTSPRSGIGMLAGTILDQESNQPIPDILVSAGGQRIFSDANGKYQIVGLGQGVHNVVFYSMNGKYRTYQQTALIQTGKKTPADVRLKQLPKVNVTFLVTPPNDAMGAPVFIAGNISQFGNTFADLHVSMSIKPMRMPMLNPQPNGTLALTIQLYAETDLRYKFTLGDGYWNAELTDSGSSITRQLIVPSEDITISHTINSWRTPGVEPITFLFDIPPAASPGDSKFIQFLHDKSQNWTEPLPLWPIGNHRYLFILFSPLNPQRPIKYQFCRNEDCIDARDADSLSLEREVFPSGSPQTVELTLDRWQKWNPIAENASVLEAFIPSKSTQYNRIIELSPEMNSTWLTFAPRKFNTLEGVGVDTIIFSPQCSVYPNLPYLQPEIGATPYHYEIMAMLDAAQSDGIDVALFPQLGPQNTIVNWWDSINQLDNWWEIFFSSYRRYLLNYAKIAQDANVSQLIIGGKALLPGFDGGRFPDGTTSTVPSNSDEDWLSLIDEIRIIFDGNLIWATNINQKKDPLPGFINEFDEIYLSVDSPLAIGEHSSFEMIQEGFISVIDHHIYEVYRSTQKPITLALAYPSVELSTSGCAIINEDCYNNGLFMPDEMKPYIVDLEIQALIYNAVFPVIASRNWITGISVRGYNPIIKIHDGSSSIAGKPAFDVIQYWFTNMKP